MKRENQTINPFKKPDPTNSFIDWNNYSITKRGSEEPLLRGPGAGAGVGCGAGFGFGLVGGVGYSGWPWNHLKLAFGFGVGCGVGIGFGYGDGFGFGSSWDSIKDDLFPKKKKKGRCGSYIGL